MPGGEQVSTYSSWLHRVECAFRVGTSILRLIHFVKTYSGRFILQSTPNRHAQRLEPVTISQGP